jgi:hypothetical protein
MRYNPLSYWFFQGTVYNYIDKTRQAPWNPTFTYVFGYDDWHPYTFSLLFGSYTGNRFQPNRAAGERFTRFEQGGVSLGWKFPFPKIIERVISVSGRESTLGQFGYNVVPAYLELRTLSTQHWKQSASFLIHHNIYKQIYVEVKGFYYPYHEQQQPWDPDFTYGFGYFDYRPGRFSIQYNNYSGNRFPWRPRSANTGTFRDASVTLSWGWNWQ